MVTVFPYHNSREKRLFDIVIGSLLLLASIPFLLLSCTWVWFVDGNPVFFAQKRSGKNKKPFTIFKIRTMIKNAEKVKRAYSHLNQAPAPMFKIFDDPRFIKGGKFLSSTGIDELPQLINVLRGEMSLVGPRPLPTSEAKKLGKSWQFRFGTKPGLFSIWTIDDSRHKTSKSWKELEIKTVTKGNLVRDLQIIAATIYYTLSKATTKLITQATLLFHH